MPGNYSFLTTLVPEPDPIEDALHRIKSVDRIMFVVHRWQEDEVPDLVEAVKAEVNLRKSQIDLIREIGKEDTEVKILKLVTKAVNIPVEGYFPKDESDGKETQDEGGPVREHGDGG